MQLNKPETYAQAQINLQNAIVISQEIGDTPTQAQSLATLGQLFTKKNQPQLAIVFYKQSASLYESIRTSNRTLPKDQQETYTKTIKKSYRDLADLLLKNDRILEAQQVLDLLKVQELNTYLKNVRGASQSLEKPFLLKPRFLKNTVRFKLMQSYLGRNSTRSDKPQNPHDRPNKHSELVNWINCNGS